MVRIKGLTFGYNQHKDLFSDLNLTISPGQIHGLLGLNGAGKSTLLHLIHGLKFGKRGRINVFGENPAKRKIAHFRNSFFLAEEIFTPSSTLKSFVDMYASFYPHFSLQDFLKFLNEFEMDHNSHLSNMSMGQKKKTLIAFGLATNTRLLILDEPTNGLDIPSKKQFRKILSHIITDDRLFIISTHQIRDLHSLIDNVIALKDGQVIFNHTIEEICNSLHFSLTPVEAEGTGYIYKERIPGGYLNIQARVEGHSFEPDLEVLFNAIMSHPERLLAAFEAE